jgi:hypothetical protein
MKWIIENMIEYINVLPKKTKPFTIQTVVKNVSLGGLPVSE